ncbi:hypothetical protein REPUB_Repub03eG0091000 [Reevesia pubescens]
MFYNNQHYTKTSAKATAITILAELLETEKKESLLYLIHSTMDSPFKGVVHDFKGRKSCYKQDWDATFRIGLRILAPTTYIFFVYALLVIAFEAQLRKETVLQKEGMILAKNCSWLGLDAIFNACVIINKFTRIAGELFGMLIDVLFMQQAIKLDLEQNHLGDDSELELYSQEIFDELTTSRGELRLRSRSFADDKHGQVKISLKILPIFLIEVLY